MQYRIISADDHIDLPWLPKDLWQKRVPTAWRERAHKVIETPDGPYWVCGAERVMSEDSAHAQAARW